MATVATAAPPRKPMPQEPLEVLLMAVQHKCASGDFHGAHALAARAAATHADSAPAADLHGTLCLQLGNLSEAVPSLERAMRLMPTNWRVATNLASGLLQLGRGAEAVAAARRSVDLQPKLLTAHLVLANALRLTGDLQGALASARDALRLNDTVNGAQHAETLPDAALLLLGDILVDLGQLKEAWQHALTAANAAQHTGAAMARACVLAGRVQEANGQYEGALAAYEKATRLDPEARRPVQLRTAVITQVLRSCLVAKRDDIFIATYPKSGTTWMQQVVCMLSGEPADVDIQMRAPYVEAALATSVFSLASLAALPPPRIFKTHAAWPQLPVAGCTASAPPDQVRVVVVVRDPRDVMVSLYYHSRSIKGISYRGSWSEWFESFLAGTVPLPMAASNDGTGEGGNSCDWFEHTVGWWRVSKAHPRSVLWVRYEDLLVDPLAQVRKVEQFLGGGTTRDEARYVV